MTTLTFDAIRQFCLSRPVELALAPCEQVGGIALHADFELYGDFFQILANDVEYVQIPGRFWVGGLVMGDWQQLSAKIPEWKAWQTEYSGPALIMWASDQPSSETTWHAHCFVIVASEFNFVAGRDWRDPTHP